MKNKNSDEQSDIPEAKIVGLIERLTTKFKAAELESKQKTGKASCPVSLWLPPAYKADYDELQKRSDNKFGKLLQELCKNAIDSVK